ncbi:putative U3 small nucleolar RNA-associated protein [Thamnocephalis sphaerospora]|uniref:Putative U3 small nucleolar RNA-associated protein n=1 Tax=Thamnocephalis sphaerospora TaxID=78915 RepID=A0A4P9XLC1_9FUNG|nr:putative U3 small nucleolar RNA-associated protein [Thamnocephalis sphaerospora]|eukprot:RKP06605.1 putative U3 small nucleolar RNA-associated protein [Thamnocephalis sphaerospora]
MSAQAPSYRKLTVKQFPRVTSQRENVDGKYWKKFQAPVLVKEYGTVNAIAFSPAAPHDFAVAASARVQMYGGRTRVVQRTVSRFKEPVHAVDYRADGRLLVAGDGEGLVQVFDANSRAILRTLRGHTRPVHVTRFASNNTQVLTCSDDRSVRLWDLPSEQVVVQFDEHQDYVRAGRFSTDNPSLFITASYDHTVRLWDARSSQCAMVMQHGQPVEDVIAFPGGGLIVSAGGPTLKLWDLLAGGRLTQAIGNHQKTVTSLAFAMDATRLVTGSLDQHVKIYDPQTWQVVHTVRQPAPVLSIGMSPNDSVLAVGMSSGMLALRTRRAGAEDATRREERAEVLQQGAYRFFSRGVGHELAQDDFVVEARRVKKLAAYDKYLRSFQYGNALDAALSGRHQATIVVSLLQELIHRGGLKMALSRRDDVALEPLLRFLCKTLPRPRYTSILMHVAERVLDIYEPVLTESPLTAGLLSKLKVAVHQEVRQQQELVRLMGSLEMVLSVASLSAASAIAGGAGAAEHDADADSAPAAPPALTPTPSKASA